MQDILTPSDKVDEYSSDDHSQDMVANDDDNEFERNRHDGAVDEMKSPSNIPSCGIYNLLSSLVEVLFSTVSALLVAHSLSTVRHVNS
jgi:hypothetical protein